MPDTNDLPEFLQQDLFRMEEEVGPSDRALKEKKEKEYQQMLIEQMNLLPPLRDYPVKGKPLLHQERALREADMHKGHALWGDPGCGKTFITIGELGLAYKEGRINGAIILAPNGPHMQWIDEQFPLWADYPWFGIHNKMSPTKLNSALESIAHIGGGQFNVLAMNHDAIRFKSGMDLVNRFYTACGKKVALINDESQKMKDWEAQRTRNTMQLAKACKGLTRCLSGTPILKGVEDLWAQYEISHPWQGITGFDNYYAFRGYYCEVERVWAAEDPRATAIVGYKNEDELRDKTRPHVTRVMADEFMKGKKPTFMKVSTPMTGPQLKAYKDMKTTLVSYLDNGLITAKNALVGLQKLMQISSGFIYPSDDMVMRDPGTNFEILGTNKTDAVITLLEGLDEPVLVWAPYRALHVMLEREILKAMRSSTVKLERRPVTIYEDRDSITHWKEEGGILIANQGGGAGVGQNLQNSAANIYVANNFSAEARWQSLKRTDRIGQKRQVRVWDLMTPDSTDYTVLANLQKKEDISRDNIDALRSIIK